MAKAAGKLTYVALGLLGTRSFRALSLGFGSLHTWQQ